MLDDKVLERLKFLAAREVPSDDYADNSDDFYCSGFFENTAVDVYDVAVMAGETLLARELLAMIEVPQT